MERILYFSSKFKHLNINNKVKEENVNMIDAPISLLSKGMVHFQDKKELTLNQTLSNGLA